MIRHKRNSVISIAVLFGFCSIPGVVPAQTVKLHISSKAGDRLSAKPDLQFNDSKFASGATFEINDAVKLQQIDGFGASIMEAGIMTLNTLPAAEQESVVPGLFASKE